MTVDTEAKMNDSKGWTETILQEINISSNQNVRCWWIWIRSDPELLSHVGSGQVVPAPTFMT